MKLKHLAYGILVVTLGLLACLTAFALPTRQEALDRADELIGEYPDIATRKNVELYQAIMMMGQESVDSIPSGLQSFLEAIADCTENNTDIRCAALYSLRLFNSYANVIRMSNFLNDPSCLQVRAAEALVSWGLWDEGSPTLIEREEYEPLVDADSSKARSVLTDALTKASPWGRIKAANQLQRYGDSSSLVDESLTIISAYLDNLNSYSDTSNMFRACDYSVTLAIERDDTSLIGSFANGLNHNTRVIRSVCLKALFHFAVEGNSSAKSELEKAADEASFLDTREECAHRVKLLNGRR